MIDLILDASVLVKWFKTENEGGVEAARRLEQRYVKGEISITAPTLLFIEMLNIAARRWRWDRAQLVALAEQMRGYGFALNEPPLGRVAHWAARGLSAYDACYVALAEARRAVLVTADERILSIAGSLAEPLEPAAP